MTSNFSPEILGRITECGVVAVLVIDDVRDAVPVANALLDGGIDAMELTLRTPVALDALKAVSNEVPRMLAGIGTILTREQVRQVAAAGADFGVAPGTNGNVIQAAQEVNLPFAPGIATPSDVETAIELDCRVLKFFPAEPSGGLAYLKSLSAPYAHLSIRYIPLGGVNRDNLSDYLAESVVPAVGGSWLAPRSLISQNDWATITENAKQACEVVQRVRSGESL